jgi:hypothetical protein
MLYVRRLRFQIRIMDNQIFYDAGLSIDLEDEVPHPMFAHLLHYSGGRPSGPVLKYLTYPVT